MSNKNKKAIIIGLLGVVLILTVIAVSVKILKQVQDDTLEQQLQVKTADNVDTYIESDPGLMHRKNAQAMKLPSKEVIPPVPTQVDLEKITMAPIMMVGGDVIYGAIGQLPNNKFFRIEPENLNKVFSINSPDEALKYVDFLMVTAGRSSYDRARTTVWETADYEKIGCKVAPDDPDMPLPTSKPVSQAKVSGNAYEVIWIYFTPTVPAGYHKMILQVEKNGGFTIKDYPEEAFWSCGGGVVF